MWVGVSDYAESLRVGSVDSALGVSVRAGDQSLICVWGAVEVGVYTAVYCMLVGLGTQILPWPLLPAGSGCMGSGSTSNTTKLCVGK